MRHFLHTRKPKNGGRGTRLLAALPIVVLLLWFGVVRAAHGAGGDPLWQYADTQGGKQEATASVVDAGGNVIVAGYQNLSGVNDDYYVVKFKGNGTGIAWRATYDRSGGTDQVMTVVVDGNNDVIVTGLAWNGTDNDIHTIKYDGNTGAVLWQHSFNGEANHHDAGTSVAVDSLNNIYVGGYSQNESGNDDYIIVKYSPSGPDENGAPLRFTLYDGESHGIDRVTSIAVKGDAVAVTGRSWNGTAFDMLTIQYDRDGAKLWEKRYSTGRYCTGNYVKIDSGGNVVATGSVGNDIDLDIYTVKYSGSSGDVAWEQTYNGAYDDEPNALFIDSSDHVYIAGYTWTLTTFNDIYTVKYNGATGAREWQQLFNSDNGNTDVAAATGLVVDPAGDVFVTGYSNGNDVFDFHTIKYKKDNGNQLWASSNPNGTSARPVRPVGIGLSPSGEVLVARWADTATHDLDYYVIKYDPGLLNRPTGLSGQAPSNTSIQLSWMDNSENESGFAIERCQGVGCTTFTQIATPGADVTAYLDTGLTANTYYSYRVRASGAAGYSHYSDTATVLSVMVNFVPPAWAFVYNAAANHDDFANAIAVGPDNNPVATGKSDSFPPGYSSGLTSFDYYTVKIDRATGGQIWADRYNDPTDAVDIGTCLAVDNSNAVSVSGYATLYNGHSGDVNSVYTIRYPASGPPQLWGKQYNGPSGTGATDDRAFAIASSNDASGNAVVVGHGINSAGNSDIYLIKYKGDGTELWAATPFDGTLHGDDFPSAVAIAADGSVFVTGYTEKEPDTNKYSFYTRKHNGLTGAVIWTDVYSVTSTGDNRGNNLVIDAAGDLYITGSGTNATGNKDFYTIKYNGAATTAQRVWERSFDGIAHGDDEAVAIKIDPVDGNLVVGGTSLSSTGNDDFTIIRYTPSGDVALTKTYQRPGNDDHAMAMGVDSNGNIYLTGYTDGGTYSDSLTVKFDYLGNIGNAVQYGTADKNDESTAIVVNSVDEAFVAGYAENASGNADYLVFKIDADISQPFMPYGITATSTYVTATLGWSDKSVVKDGYRIERKTGACGTSNTNPWGTTVTLPVSPRSYTDVGLNSGSTYCYRIQTFTNNGAASRWAEKTVSTPVLPAPSTLTVSSFNSTQVNLSWGDTTTAETGFRLERCSGASCVNFAPLATPAANATSYSDATPCNSTVYRYRIMAYGTGWDSPFSNIATVTTTVPGTPVLTATRNSEVQINLSWTDNNADESGFTVERCSGVDCSNFTPIATKAANSTSHNDTGLTPNTSYTYRVVAFKTASCGWTRPSVPAVGVLTTILEPNNSTAAASNTTQITVGWGDRTASETGFRIERCTGTGCSDFSQIGTAAANAVSYPDANVTQGVTYRYRVRATNGTLLWDSPYSTVVERMAPAAATPVLTATRYSEAQVNLTWTDANTDESGFRVERCAGSGCSNFVQVGNDLAANVFSYNDTNGLLPNTTYTYRVSAFKNATNSWIMPSAVKEATTTLLEPTTLAATANSTTQITLTWVDRTGSETGFKIERCEGSGCTTFAQIGTVGAGIVTYADSNVTQGVTYRYQVRATNSSVPWDSTYSTPVERMAPAAATPVLTAVRYSEAQINLSWTDTNSDEGGFKVERCTGSGCSNFSQIGTNLAANTYSYNDTTGLVPNTVYTYRVSAFKTATNSWTMPSIVKEATTTLLEPINFTCIPAPSNTTQINCSWTDRTGSETGFKIERCTTAGCSDFALHYTTAANATSYNDSTVCSGIVYNYRISATRNAAPLWDSSYSIAAPATASTPATPVLTVTSPSETQANLTWTDATADETGYKVERCSGAGCSNFVQIGSNLPPNTFSYNDTGLTPGTSYTYRVKGYKTASCPWESIGDPITIAPVIPGNTLTVATVSTTQINLTWTDTTTSETGFKVERCEGMGCSNFAEIGTAVANATTYNDTSVCSGYTYSYRVRATKSTAPAWDSAYSNTAAGITPSFNNLLADSGFENSTSGWPTAVGTLTGTSSDATTVHNGAKSLKLAATGALLGRLQSVTVIPGRQYVLSGYLNTSLTAGKAQCDVSGTGIDSPGIAIAYNDAVKNNAGWVNLSETVTIPVGTTTVAVRCFADVSTQGTAYIDAVSLAPADFILTATRISDVQVNLSWLDSVVEETGYKIERCSGAGCSNFVEVSTAAANATSFNDPSLTGNTTYRYQIRGYKSGTCAWNSGYSTTAEAVTTALAPSGLTATAPNTTQINLSWTDNTLSETAFKVERCAGAGCSDFVELPTPAAANATTYQDTTVAAGTTYQYRVRATHSTAGWNSGYSNTASAGTAATTTPVLTAARISEAQINLTWTDTNTDESGFKVERCTGSGCSTFVQIGSNLAPNTFSYNDSTGLIPDTVYTYRVSAFKTATPNGWSMPSVSKEATTTLNGPNSFTCTPISTTQINCSWTDRTASETGFKVERCTGTGCTVFAQIGTAVANVTTYSDTSVAQGTTYRYQVRATNSTLLWDSTYSSIVELMAPAALAPALTATAVSDVRINLSWTDPTTDETGYRLERCTGEGCSDFAQIGGNLAPNTTTYSDLALTPSTTYVYRVSGYKTATSPWTMTGNTAPASTTVLGPINLGVTVIDTTTTRLAWTNLSTTETGISIERCMGAGCSDFAVIATIGAGQATYNDTTPCNNQPYSYRVQAINTVVPWTTAYTNTASITIPVPVAPTLLTAARVNETQINLSWTDNTTDEAGYKIERCEGAGCSNFTQLTTVLANVHTFNNTGLTPNTTYRYRVRAYKSPSGGCAWDSGYSNISEAVTSIAVPTALTATTPNSTQMNLAWTNNTVSETGYKIERCTGAGCADFVQIFALTGKTTSWTDNTVAAGTTYRYQIRATNTTIPWDSGYSNSASGNTYPQDPPVLSATATSIKVTLNWVDRTVDETGFKIERCTGAACADYAQIALAAANATTYIDTAVCNGTTYNYRVRATKSTDRTYDTLYSNVVPATTSAGIIALTASRASEIQINLSWTDPTAEEDGYRVERCVGSGCSDFTQMAALAKNSVSWTDASGLLPGYTYTYRIKNYNSTAPCPWETSSNITSAVTSISVPTGLAAVAAGMNQINLSWSDSTVTKTGFKIERCTGATCTNFAQIALLTGSATTWSDTSVVASTTYRYRVRATKTTSYAWDSGYSSIASATTASLTIPAAPTALSAARISNSQINLTWNDVVTDGAGYRIERCSGTGCSNFSEVATVGAGVKTYANNGLTGSTTYGYRVRGYKTAAPAWTTAYSNTSYASTAIDSPTALTATAITASEIKLTWMDNSGSVNGYNIEEQIWNGEWVTISSVGAHVTSYTDNVGKEPLKPYIYRIKAFNGVESSSYSNVATVTTPAFATEDPTCALPNPGPAISSTAGTSASEGTEYIYQVVATAQGGRNPLTYTLVRKPDGMTVSTAGLIAWTPGYSQGGDQNVTVRVTDSAGFSSDQSFAITVGNVNRPPVFTSTAVTTALSDHPYSYQAAASDPEGDSLTYTLVVSPSGMTISSGGLVSWTPNAGHVGDNNVTIRVSDGNFNVDQPFTMTVTANHPPYFISTPVITASEGAANYSYQVTGSDPDGDAVTYTLITAPAGMTITSGNLITWTPTVTQTQTANPVTIRVSDGFLTANQDFTVTVLPNSAPVIPTTPVTIATENSLYTYAVAATDSNGDAITYTLTGAPNGMTISAAGVINWTPDYNQAGLPSPTVTVRAADTMGLYAEKSFTITVTNVNRPPVITSTAITTGTVGVPYSYQVTGTDPDGTAVSGFTLTTAPAGMSISGTGLISWTPTVDQATNAVTVSVSDGALTATQTFNVDVQGPPAVPTLIPQGNFTSNCGGASVTLSWNPVTGPRGHAVQYAVQVSGGGGWSAWQSGTSYALGVSPLSSYTWEVKARDGVTLLESGASSPNTFGDNTTYCCSGCECDDSCGDPPPSSCPLVYSFNGSQFTYETDIAGPVISQFPKGPRTVSLYQPVYVVLEGLALNGNHQYQVKIWESLNEGTILDEAKLLAVDYPIGYEIATSSAENTYYNGYVEPFRIYTLKDPVLPISATDKNGADIKATLLEVDDFPAPMTPDATDNFYIFDFGTITHPEYAKLVIDGWMIINSKLYTSPTTIKPSIEVVDAGGNWVKVKTIGMPAGDLKTMVVDLSGVFLSSDHRIRLNLGVRKTTIWVIDRIRLDQSAPVNVALQQIQSTSADLQVGGQAIVEMSAPDHRIHVGDNLPLKAGFYGYGNFTRLGEVNELLTQRDDKYVLMNYADKLELKFPEPLPPQPGMKRGFMLKTDLYYKEFKAYKYLEPLPFHGMSDYPPPAPEAYPTDADHNQYQLNYNTRVFAP